MRTTTFEEILRGPGIVIRVLSTTWMVLSLHVVDPRLLVQGWRAWRLQGDVHELNGILFLVLVLVAVAKIEALSSVYAEAGDAGGISWVGVQEFLDDGIALLLGRYVVVAQGKRSGGVGGSSSSNSSSTGGRRRSSRGIGRR